jgi:hypothetical protein
MQTLRQYVDDNFDLQYCGPEEVITAVSEYLEKELHPHIIKTSLLACGAFERWAMSQDDCVGSLRYDVFADPAVVDRFITYIMEEKK